MKRQKKPRRALKVTVIVQAPGESMPHPPRPKVPLAHASAIRAKTGMTQAAFAASIGVSLGTLINWEQGRRQPTGPAKILLALLEKKPSLVADLYPAPRPTMPQWTPGSADPNQMTAEERLSEVGQILAQGAVRMRMANT